jgi:hypothetical protein
MANAKQERIKLMAELEILKERNRLMDEQNKEYKKIIKEKNEEIERLHKSYVKMTELATNAVKIISSNCDFAQMPGALNGCLHIDNSSDSDSSSSDSESEEDDD